MKIINRSSTLFSSTDLEEFNCFTNIILSCFNERYTFSVAFTGFFDSSVFSHVETEFVSVFNIYTEESNIFKSRYEE